MNFRLIALICVLLSALGVSPLQASQQTGVVDARAEIAAALYAASATQAATERFADAQLDVAKGLIAELQKKVRVGDAQRRAALTTAQEQFVAALEAKDRAYAQEIAVFRGAVTDVASTPGGVAALARFNDGDEVGALAILDKLQAANDAARRTRANIESAAEKRRIAELALEANNRSKVSIASVIERYEEVTTLDPGVSWDWIELDRLYQSAGLLTSAREAAQTAVRLATTERYRSVAFGELGDVLVTQGDLPGALTNYREQLAIFRHLSAADPGNTGAQRDVVVTLERIGDVLEAHDDLAGAGAAYEEELAIARRLLAADRDNADAQRLAVASLIKTGDVLDDQGKLADARACYEESLSMARRLWASDSSNADAQRDVAVTLERIGNLLEEQNDFAAAHEVYEKELTIYRRLSAADPGNADAQRDVATGLYLAADALMAQRDFAGARKASEESLAIRRSLSAADPSNASAQGDLSESLNEIGEVLMAQSDPSGARTAYDESFTIARRLSAADPGNVVVQRDVSMSLWKLAEMPNSGVRWSDVVMQMERMDKSGMLNPSDRKNLEDARQRAAKEIP